MKRNLTIRRGILLLLLLFGLIIGGTIFFSVRYTRDSFVENEYKDAIDDLKILAQQIDMNLRVGSLHPYRFLEATATVQAEDENFSYLVRDTAGMVLAPAFAAGKPLPISKIQWLTKDKGCCIADVWGYPSFVVIYPIPNRSLELVAVYDNKYVFADIYRTLNLFVLIMCAIYLALVLLSWFWIIPALERTLERKQRVENELASARRLQVKAVAETFPVDPRYEVYAVLRPARDVGGDIYGCQLVDGKLFFVVGDVSDKGTAAAFMMFMLSSFMHSRIESGISLADLMEEVNRLICDNPDYEMFCTLFIGFIDPETKEMEYCNAGHTRTLLDGEFLDQDPQLIAGIMPGFSYHTQKVQLRHGSRLLLYTDGVTEARDMKRGFFGEERLQAWMQARPAGASCRNDCEDLMNELDAFRGKAVQNDDIAIMSIKII